jgi:hypothetical protein
MKASQCHRLRTNCPSPTDLLTYLYVFFVGIESYCNQIRPNQSLRLTWADSACETKLIDARLKPSHVIME